MPIMRKPPESSCAARSKLSKLNLSLTALACSTQLQIRLEPNIVAIAWSVDILSCLPGRTETLGRTSCTCRHQTAPPSLAARPSACMCAVAATSLLRRLPPLDHVVPLVSAKAKMIPPCAVPVGDFHASLPGALCGILHLVGFAVNSPVTCLLWACSTRT